MESKIIEIIITVLLVIFAIWVLRCEPVIRLSDVYTGQRYTYQIIIRMKDKCDMGYTVYSDFFYSTIAQIVERRKKDMSGEWICLAYKDTEIRWNQNEIKEIVMMREENKKKLRQKGVKDYFKCKRLGEKQNKKKRIK